MEIKSYRQMNSFNWYLLLNKLETYIMRILGNIFSRSLREIFTFDKIYIYTSTVGYHVTWAATDHKGTLLGDSTFKTYMNVGLHYRRRFEHVKEFCV